MTFDATKEAVKIEHLAAERIDSSFGDKGGASRELAKEWLGLSATQRTEVGKVLEQKYDNSDWNPLPKPHVELDAKGECTGISFSASKLDIGSKVDDFQVRALSPSTGGQFAEVASNEGKDKGFQWLDGLAFDKPSTEANLTKEALKTIGGLPYDKSDSTQTPGGVPAEPPAPHDPAAAMPDAGPSKPIHDVPVTAKHSS